MLSADVIVKLHDESIAAWHAATEGPPDSTYNDPWLARVARQHRANFDLWHIEDEARTPGATDAQLAGVKRRIDQTNQLRNDLVEELDRTLLDWLAPQRLPAESSELHSESPGLIIDRLSILALKIYHTREETERTDCSPGHADRNRSRLAILTEQRADLAHCLDMLWRATLDGTRRFKLYRQLKMYNDPTLNPAIYRSAQSESGR
jgi:hypothetical protein